MKKEKGITLVALTITIIVLLILAGIGVYSGKETIKKAKLEELKTNMLLIQAKAREYVEEVNFRMGIGSEEEKNARKETARQEIYEQEQGLKKVGNNAPNYVSDSNSCYELTNETKEKWGLSKIELGENERYLIQFDETNLKVEIYNTEGYDGKYSLTDIDTIKD